VCVCARARVCEGGCVRVREGVCVRVCVCEGERVRVCEGGCVRGCVCVDNSCRLMDSLHIFCYLLKKSSSAVIVTVR
jgi:hypothetical protein